MNLQEKGAKADEEAQKPRTNEKEEFSIYTYNFFMTFAVPYSILFCLVIKIAKVKVLQNIQAAINSAILKRIS